MSENGLNSLQLISLSKLTVDKDREFKGFNSDNGLKTSKEITSNKSAKVIGYEHNNAKGNIGNVINVFDLHKQTIGTPINVPIMNPMVGNKINNTNNLSFTPATIGVKDDFFKVDGYTREDIVRYKKKMESVMEGNGALFSLDMETMGVNPRLDPGAPKLNKENYAITELSLWKTTYDTTENKWVREKVKSVYSRPNSNDFYASMILKDGTANSDTAVMLDRIAGYSGKGSIVKNPQTGQYEVRRWAKNVDVTSEQNITNGIKNLKNLPARGSAQNVSEMKDFMETVTSVLGNESNILTSKNGLMFDLPHLIGESYNLGIDKTTTIDPFLDSLKTGHFDLQIIRPQLASKKTYEKAQKLRAEGVDVTDSLALENLNKINTYGDKALGEEIERTFGGDIAHTADYDTFMTTIESIKVYEDAKDELAIFESSSMKAMDLNEKSKFIANGKFVADKNSYHFKIEDGRVNSYNSSILTRDQVYNLKVSKIKSIDEINDVIKSNQDIAKELNKVGASFEDVSGKYMIELEASDNPKDKVLMFYDDIEGFQKNMIDSNLLSQINETEYNQWSNRVSRNHNDLDDLRKEMEGHGTSTSWKQVDRLESYVNQYNDLQHNRVQDGDISRTLTKEEINTILKGESVSINGTEYNADNLLSHLSNGFVDDTGEYVGNVSSEKLKSFRLMYDDLEKNADLYSNLLEEGRKNVNGGYINTYEGDDKISLAFDEQLDKNQLDDLSLTFGASIDQIEQDILNSKTDSEKLKYAINKDEELLNIYNSKVKKAKAKVLQGDAEKLVEKFSSKKDYKEMLKEVVLSSDEEEKLMKKAFKERYREAFDVDSKTVNALLKDSKELFNRNALTSLDILTPDDGYTAIKFNNKADYIEDLKRNINMRVRDEYKDKAASNRDRLIYADDIAGNLKTRGLLSEEDFDIIQQADNVQSKSALIGEKLFHNKEQAKAIVETSLKDIKGIDTFEDAILAGNDGLKNLYNPKIVNDEDFAKARPFVENVSMQPKWYRDTRSIMGKPLSEHVKRLKISTKDIVKEQAGKVTPDVTLIGYSSSKKAQEDIANSFKGMYEKLGWEDKHVDIFKDLYKHTSIDSQIQMKGSSDKQNLSKFIVNDGKDYHLLISANEKLTKQKIANGETIEEIAKSVATFKLPKIEKSHGAVMISQSDIAKKTLSTSIIPVQKNNAVHYKHFDTVQEVLTGIKDSLPYVKERLEDRDYISANRRLNKAWRDINESKSLTASTYKYVEKDGQLAIEFVYGINRADVAKADLINHTGIIYELDSVLNKSTSLKDKFYSLFSTNGTIDEPKKLQDKLAKLTRDIADHKEKGKPSYKKHITDLGTDGTKISVFLRNNIEEISKTLLDDKDFMDSRGKDIRDYLETMAEKGNVAIISKPTEAGKGYVNPTGLADYVPHSNISNTARETMIQGMNGQSIYEDSIMAAYKHRLKDVLGEVKDADEIYNKLGIKRNFGVTTPKTLELSNSFYEKSGGTLAFSTKVKSMTANQMNDGLVKIYNNTDGLHKVIQDEILNKYQIKATSEEIKEAAKLISASSSLYEDSAMMNVMLADIVNPITATNQKVYKPNEKLKIGMKVNSGDIIGYDVHGKPIMARDTSVIKNIDNGMMIFQLEENNLSIKGNFNHSEKAVMIAPSYKTGDKAKDERMKKILSEVQYKLTGKDVNIAINASAKKHDALNTVLISNEMAITEAITNDDEAEIVRKAFKKHAPNLDIDVEYDNVRKGYTTLNSPRITSLEGVNPIDEFQAVVKSLENEGDLGKRISQNMNLLKDNNIAFMDVVFAANNTVERGMNGLGEGSGTSISTRSMVVKGTYRELDKDLVSTYENGTFFKTLVDGNANKILNANKEGAREVANIYAALDAMDNEKAMPFATVKKKSIKDIILPNGLVETNKLDEMFKYDGKTNLFEIDLSDFGIELDNPFYVEGGKNSKKISKIFMPATRPNVQGSDGARANKLQSAQVDLLRKIKEARYLDGNSEKSAKQAYKDISYAVDNFMHSMFFELTDNDGLRYKIQGTKENIGSFRAEAHKVIAPVIDKETGLLKDLSFGDKITSIKNGEIKYTKSIFLNENDIKKLGVNFDMLGDDILSKQVADSGEQLDFLKKYMKGNGVDISHVKDLEEAQNIIKTNHSKSFTNENLASRFLEEIGFEGEVSRDPIIRHESESGVRIRSAKGVNSGGVALDPITAQSLKADSDGDKLNIMFKSFFADEKGNLKILGYDAPERKELRIDSEGTSNSSLARLGSLSKDLEEFEGKNKNLYSLDEYRKFSNFKDMVDDVSSRGDVSYFTNPTARQITTNALLSKDLVGHTSNPGLYIKMAGLEVASDLNKVDTKQALAFDKSLSIGTLVIEQNAIDQKLNKFGPSIASESTNKLFNAIDMGENWKNLHEAVRSKDNEKIRKSLTAVIEMITPYTTEDTDPKYQAIKWQDGSKPKNAEDVSKIVDNILNRTAQRSDEINTVFAEEFLNDVITTFRDDKASKLYESAFTARSGSQLYNVRSKIHDEMSKVIALRDGSEYGGMSTSVAIKQANFKANLSDTVSIGEVALEEGQRIAVVGQSSNIEQGLYDVKLNGYKDGRHSITLTGENGTATISKDDVFEINNVLSQSESYIVSDEEIKKYEDILFNNYKAGVEEAMTSSHGAFNGHVSNYKGIMENGGPTTIKDKALVSAVEGYNIDNLSDMHKTLDVLGDKNYVLDDRSSILKQMNDEIRAKGTKEYQAKKKEIIMGQKGMQQYPISSYDKFMNDISKSVAEIKPTDYGEIKDTLNQNKRINMKALSNSQEIEDAVMKSIELSGREFTGMELEEVKFEAKEKILGYFKSEDEKTFNNINNIYTKNQYDSKFREEVLGWNMNEVDELLIKGKEKDAIHRMNDMTMIFSKDFSGKKLGEMSLDELKSVLDLSDNTGIHVSIAKENIDMVKKLIQLRQNDDIMLESIHEPIVNNLSDNMGKELTDQMVEDIRQKGKKAKKNKTANKSTLSSLSDMLDGAKSKISGLSTKQKILAGAMVATGVGATMMLGNNVSNGKSKLSTPSQETESNLKNSSLPKAPPSQGSVYVSDNNSINVNVRGRSPINSSPDMAERAISALFGKSVSVNSNISDSRETIHDRDVNELMTKAIR